jgi:hypothetical protein
MPGHRCHIDDDERRQYRFDAPNQSEIGAMARYAQPRLPRCTGRF